jgi:Domain of unknown function (DUF4388)
LGIKAFSFSNMWVAMTERPKRDALKGSLQQLPFPKILNILFQSSKTGILALTRGPKKIHIHFDQGKIAAVTSTHFPGFSLGEYLVQQKQVSQEIADISFKNTRAGDSRQGFYLVDKGYLTPHSLFDALNSHITLKLFKVFEWPEGDFFFKDGEIVEEADRILQIDVANLVYIGVRDHASLQKLPAEFRGRKETPLHKRSDCPYREEDLAFGPTGTRVFSLVNGVRTLRQIVALTKLKKSVAYKTIYGMFLLGFIGFPESVQKRGEKSVSQKTKLEQDREAKAAEKKDGYEISIGDDIIAQALKSVDDVKKRVASEKTGETITSQEPSAAMSAGSEPVVRPIASSVMGEGASASALPQAPEALTIEPAPESPKEKPDVLDEMSMPDSFEMENQTLSLSDEKQSKKGSGDEMAVPDEAEFEFEEFGADDGAQAEPDSESSGVADEEALQELDDLGLEVSEDSLWGEDATEEESESKADLSVEGFGDEKSETSAGDDPSGAADSAADSSLAFVQAAERLIDKGNFAEAKTPLDAAIAADPECAEAYVYQGWCVFNLMGTPGADEAEKLIKTGMNFNQKLYQAYLFLGKINAAQNQMDFAELYFIKSLELNVNCNEARDEIRKIHKA